MLSKTKRICIWLVWAIFLPLILFYVYRNSPILDQVDYKAIVSFIVLTVLIALFPITIGKTPIFLINSISLAVFLIFGLGIEILITQIGILTVLARVKVNYKDCYRIPLNMMMFLVVSLSGAGVYYLLDNVNLGWLELQIHEINGSQIIGYAMTTFMINQLLLHTVKRYIYQIRVRIFDEGFYFSLLMIGYMLPIALTFVYMYAEFGLIGIYVVGVPIVSISISIKLYYASRTINSYLQSANTIAQKLTGQLDRSDVIDVYLTALPDIFPIEQVSVYDVSHETELKLIRSYQKETGIAYQSKELSADVQTIAEQAWKNDQMINESLAKNWQKNRLDNGGVLGESVVAVPVKRDQEIVSVIVLVAKDKRAYTESLLSILIVLNNYLGVALENAKHYEESKLEGQTDHLTGLPNYRFIERVINRYKSDSDPAKPCSLILLDLDRFKKVNDVYGHECGNEVLQKIARRMDAFIANKGIVARYGGEEFIVFLPNSTKMDSYRVAEELLELIASKPFRCEQHMLADEGMIDIKITASIGVANYPEHCEDPNELIRLADRSMYVGAKNNGRNRVAVYQ